MQDLITSIVLENLLPIVVSFILAFLTPYLRIALTAVDAFLGQKNKQMMLATLADVVDRGIDAAFGPDGGNSSNPHRSAAVYVWGHLRETIEELGGSFSDIESRVNARIEQRQMDPLDPLDVIGLRAAADLEAAQSLANS